MVFKKKYLYLYRCKYFVCLEYLWKDTQKTRNSGCLWEKELSDWGTEIRERLNFGPFILFEFCVIVCISY